MLQLAPGGRRGTLKGALQSLTGNRGVEGMLQLPRGRRGTLKGALQRLTGNRGAEGML
jgi:hypothetical protein